MDIVDTPSPKGTLVARKPDGKVDLDAYVGAGADFMVGDLTIRTTIQRARTRFGHLDLLVTPVSGDGARWVERKNLVIANDPATPAIAPSESFWAEDASETERMYRSISEEVRSIIDRVEVK